MKCPRCHHENEASAKFCEECAAPLARKCGNCGRQLSPKAKFCPECAHPAGLEPAVPIAPRFNSPETYTPKHLAERILNSRAAVEGERKQVTVLFADLKGSMELLADRDPEEARNLLDPVLAHMMEAVHRYEGTVNQVMGDGIMALFGAPLAHEDHAIRACYAALRMQESVTRYADGVFRAYGIPIQIRQGLNSGEVVVRAIGSDLHMDYTAVGHTTHLAARMEQMAIPGTILLAPATLQLAEGYVQVAARGPVAVKGLSEPVEVFVLTGVGAQRTRFHAAAARGLTRFVGRDTEIEQIRRALALAHGGRGQVVSVVGEPGVGKSRLVYEFTHSHRTQDWVILEAGSVSYGKATSYLPVIDLLKAYFKVHDREPHREIREKVIGKLLTLDRTLEPTLPALLALLDVPVEDARWNVLDPAQRRQRTLDAVKRLLIRESQDQPVLLVFEDLHWIDSETQALLDALVESLPTARLLLLVNYRPEYRHGWVSKTYYSQLRLDALPPESAGELLNALLGDDPALELLKRLLVKSGNPLFIEESVRTLVETRALIGQRGAYHLTRPIQAIEVPATVQVILAARIDRLSPEHKQLLQIAAVIGKDVPFVLLHVVAELAEDVVHQGLGQLRAAEFLYETRLFPDLEYSFKHALTHEVTYGTLLHEKRKALHARIVGAIERLYPGRLTEHLEALAYHAVRGEVWERAVTYLRQAGLKAFSRSANREAVTCFEQALTALAHLPETRETLQQAIDVRFDLRTALFPLGLLERISTSLREAERFAKALDDSGRLGRVSVYMGHYFWVTGSSGQAQTAAKSAQIIGNTLDDLSLQVGGNFYLGASYHDSADYGQAEALFRNVMQALPEDLSRERCGLTGFPAAMSRWLIGECLAERGVFDEALLHAHEGVRLAEAIDHAYSLALVCCGLGYVYDAKGELDAAMRVLERALAISRDWNLAAPLAIVAPRLGSVYARSGRVAESFSLLRQGVAELEAIGLGYSIHSEAIMRLAEAFILVGQLDDASAHAERSLSLARERGQRGVEPKALHVLGEVASHRDPAGVETAAGHYLHATSLAQELRMRPVVAHCHFGLAKLYRRAGERERAREYFTTATTMYREMDMRFWLQRAVSEIGVLP